MVNITYVMQRSIAVAWILIFGAGLLFTWWAFDRSPPFELKEYTFAGGRRGESALLIASVERDIDRHCSVTFSRYMVDSRGARSEMGGVQYMTASALEQMSEDNPDKLILSLKLPNDVAVGPAKLVTSLEYVCNPIHRIWPIDVLLEMKVEVLP